MAKVTLRWLEGTLMTASDSNNHSVVLGRSAEEGEPWLGMKPAELLLVAAASCSAWDVVKILQKQKEPLRSLRVDCVGEQLSEPPFRYTSIHLVYVISGEVNEQKARRAIQLSHEKYCSVINSLHADISISHELVIQKG